MSQSWPLKRVGLRVRNLEPILAYYQQLGFIIVRDERAEGIIGMGVGEQEILTLRHTPDARPRSRHTAGLYHFAILLPGETDLSSFLRHSVQGDGVRIDGSSDHLVSQALYLNDPEGNGIEVYADRPREEWTRKNGQLSMDTLPLKVDALLAKASPPFQGFPVGTILGHMHLNVRNLEESLAFYQETFGLELMLDLYHQASFVSWSGYHHHLALNTWAGPNASAHEADVSGLDFFEIARPDLASGTYQDPNGITVIVS
ncbi:MAG TPA: VOC family protein [Ktedonobacteraceae bacterium]|nr:VOC family protein [Ktedonobacteraceae bacterium]